MSNLAKKPLLNEDEIRKMKEEESKKMASGSARLSFNPADDELDRSFEHILNNSAVPRMVPTVIRTKKAENRMAACSPSPTLSGEPLNSVEQRAMEHQKRQEWRQARFKSLEADSKAAEEVMQQVEQINSRLANITEEHSNCSLPVNEKILQNETSFERNEYIDPITGATTVSVVEKSFTQREINTSSIMTNDLSGEIANNSKQSAEIEKHGGLLNVICVTVCCCHGEDGMSVNVIVISGLLPFDATVAEQQLELYCQQHLYNSILS
ncbi:unnamed protein product [Litomosoides sigmodontis]|uniref:Uncharacterized protein n=1 Tax=Litomosoides sigmodontis TaxID=42156 RepID=A0A3P6S0K6_LITSI|nr:unnamed protein product [Litomosoides sigmodontis]